MQRVSVWWLTGAAAVAGAGLLAILDLGGPGGPADPILRLCLLREVLHLPCPGCGMTRALAALARGELGAAVRFHPFAPVLALEGFLLWSYWGARLVRDRLRAADDAAAAVRAVQLADVLPWIGAHGAALIALWAGRLAAGDLAAVIRP